MTILSNVAMVQKKNAIEVLRKAGISSPFRMVELIKQSISFLELDLSGLTILTEAASGPYVVTPVIASLAGASRILAFTTDSKYASSKEVIDQTRALEVLCDVPIRSLIYTQKSSEVFTQADVVTNLGFVRPIDSKAVVAMKAEAVIPLMCEAWEIRRRDIDLTACKAKGILTLGTNEDYPGLRVFSYCGWLCMKMLFDAQVEIQKDNIIIVSGDKFGKVIQSQLKCSGASCKCYSSFHAIPDDELRNADVLVIADYNRQDEIIGKTGDLTAAELALRAGRHVCVIQFAGRIDVMGLQAAGVWVYPGVELEPQRMAMTLSELGPRPVIELHTAGLKVGEMGARARLTEVGNCIEKLNTFRHSELVQVLDAEDI